jgi:cation diffusion facilitator family transporter
MLEWMLKIFVPDYQNTDDPSVRERCGMLSGGVGIFLNLLLFAGKLLAGVITGAISVTADAFNNLSDAASSVVTLAGFRLAGQKPDADHPFGHGRMEYLAGLIVSLLILLVGVELGKSSIEKIISPENTEITALTVTILLCSIAVKLWMAWFNGALGRRISSDALAATAADSRSDVLATSVVLAGLIVTHFTGLRLDGWLGLAVALLILKAGWDAAKDTLDPLLGKAPDQETVDAIEKLVMSHPQVVGIHDLVIHDYGPGRRMMSVHAEVPADSDMLEVHDVIDHIERELNETFRIEAVIHMDPIQVGDPKVEALRALTAGLAAQISPEITVHDFRITAGPMHTNLIFDVVVPYSAGVSDEEVRDRLTQGLHAEDESFNPVIDIDHSYVL